MSGSDEPFRPTSHDPLPSHPAGLAIARGSSAPRGPRGKRCVRTLGPRSERRIFHFFKSDSSPFFGGPPVGHGIGALIEKASEVVRLHSDSRDNQHANGP